MKAVVAIAGLQANQGGPARTVPALCRALSQQGAELELITISEGVTGFETSDAEQAFELTRISTRTNRYSPLSWHRQFKDALNHAVSEDKTVLYDVGLWLPQNHLVARFAAKRRLPLIVSPRGMLSARALEVAKRKKQIAWTLYQRRDLAVASVLHVTSEAEAEDCRRRGLPQPIAVIPNGIDLPRSSVGRVDPAERRALFLSRLHPIKGLQDLIEAWAQVRPPGWKVIVAGPDEGGHGAAMKSLAKQLGVGDAFDFVGAVENEAKWKLFSEADLFVLPSHSESFGQAIAEALAAGLPVITTRGTPWNLIETNNCGWWIEVGVEPLKAALSRATGLTRAQLQEMGARGREMVRNNYSWEKSADRLLSVMQWLTGGAERPAWLS